MSDTPGADAIALPARPRNRDLIPGVLLSAGVAIAATGGAQLVASLLPIPAMVIALFIGIALHATAARATYQAGIKFCVRNVLRWGVALFGLRTGIAEILGLGWSTVALVIAAMLVTIGSGFLFARLFGQQREYGALVGIGTAVCGASAALATATVLPNYRGKEAEVIFTVVALNTLATAAMVLYPILAMALGMDDRTAGIFLGASIHDVAQVVGASYPVSEVTGNTAVIVKLFRVFLLFPIVVTCGWWFARDRVLTEAAKIPVPIFALMFVVLAVVNSVLPDMAAIAPTYAALKPLLIQLANGLLLVAIAALGLSTSPAALTTLGWRHLATVLASTAVILVVVMAGLFFPLRG